MFSRLQIACLLGALATLLCLGGCSTSLGEGGSGDDFEAASDVDDAEDWYVRDKRAIVDRMAQRRPLIRERLAAGTLGETDEGFLAVPPVSTQTISAEDLHLMTEDNTDREALYRTIARGSLMRQVHELVRADLLEQAPSIAQQVEEQFCAAQTDPRVCESVSIGSLVRLGMFTILDGGSITEADSLSLFVKELVLATTDAILDEVVGFAIDYVGERFGQQYHATAPSGTWIEVAGSWSQTL